MEESPGRPQRDEGLVLPLVMVVSVVLGIIVIGIASYGTANLRYAQVTESRGDQLAAADAAMSYAVNLIKIGAADCIFNDQTIDLPDLVESFNGATGSVQCAQTGGGLDSAGLFAMVLTGQGVPTNQYLVETSGGSVKQVGGPIFMERVSALAFDLSNNNGLLLNNAPLLHYDGTTPQCDAVSEIFLGDEEVDFSPDAIFGPICTGDHWYQYGPGGVTFDEPAINTSFVPVWNDSVALTAGGAMQVYDGGQPATYSATPLPLTSAPADSNKMVIVKGAYTDYVNTTVSPATTCRVFEPGRYVRPPNVLNMNAANNSGVYFKSGEYLFDFRTTSGTPSNFASWGPANISNSEFVMDKVIATAGRLDPAVNITAAIVNDACATQMSTDTANGYGATFYMSGKAHIGLDTQAVLEIMPRNQSATGDPLYISIHALCNVSDTDWCVNSPTYVANSLEPAPSDRQAPSTSGNPAIIWIKAGNNSEIVTNGLIYAPRAELEFRNVSNDAEVRMRGGMVIARATIDASASAENFEIGVGSQDVDLDLYLIATGTDTDGRSTQIVSDVDLSYEEPDVDDRLEVVSWRVCETNAC
jgi:hypothetical protein